MSFSCCQSCHMSSISPPPLTELADAPFIMMSNIAWVNHSNSPCDGILVLHPMGGIKSFVGSLNRFHQFGQHMMSKSCTLLPAANESGAAYLRNGADEDT